LRIELGYDDGHHSLVIYLGVVRAGERALARHYTSVLISLRIQVGMLVVRRYIPVTHHEFVVFPSSEGFAGEVLTCLI